jgi:Spy/CpxP family protein refolding chaperone
MNTNWKQIIPIAVLCLGISGNMAQACPGGKGGGPGKGDFKERKVEHLDSKLDLTDEQKTRVESILESKHSQAKTIFEESRPKMEALRKSTDTEIRAILTPEQQVKFDKFALERQEKHKEWKAKKEAN